MSWTDERRMKVKSLLREGKSAPEIAEALGTTKGAIVSLVHRYEDLKAVGFARQQGGIRKEDERYRIREGAASKLAAGLRGMAGRLNPDEIAARQAEAPNNDHRDLTGQLMGDPPPVDNRRAAWAPHLAGDA